MKINFRLAGVAAAVAVGVSVLWVDFASAGRGRGGGGGGRGGGGGGRVGGGGGGRVGGGGGISRPSGGGISRPSGGDISRPSGGGVSRPSGGLSGSSINRSPGVSTPRINQPSVTRPGGGNLGPRDGPGIVSPPGLTPGTRPSIGAGVGNRPNIGGKIDSGLGKGAIGKGDIGKGAIGKGDIGKGAIGKGDGGIARPGRPSTLPGLGAGLGAGIGAGIAAGKAGDILGRRQEGVADRKANIADRSNKLEDRMNDRQDFRKWSQEDRQDFLENRREDWQNWHDDWYGHHGDWWHGGWCDHWGGYWEHMWSDHTAAMVLGTTLWGVNRMSYWFGYDDYYNPYYSEPLVIENTTINYSEPFAEPPVQVNIEAPASPSQLPPGVTEKGMLAFETARKAFHDGNYQAALEATNQALVTMPKDAVIHEFRALVLFALGKYHDAATALHPVLAVGPGWDWTTMSGLYADVDTYTKQLRALEGYVDENPKLADGHFLLAYHYLTCGHNDRAAEELAQVQKLLPKDTVSAQLLQMLGKTPPPESTPESDAKIDVAKLIGAWNATRNGKANFELTLTKDKGFTWTYQEGRKKEQVKGAYALDGNVLALEPDVGGVMLAEITEPQNGSFVFRMEGAPKSDPGLTFKGK